MLLAGSRADCEPLFRQQFLEDGLVARPRRLYEVPCRTQGPKDGDVLIHQIVENWQRLEMHPFDLADALRALPPETQEKRTVCRRRS